MTVGELIERLKEMPQDAEVYVQTDASDPLEGCFVPAVSYWTDSTGAPIVAIYASVDTYRVK